MLSRQGLQFIVSVALARILSPEEFGTIALLYLFTGIAGVFVDSGFSAALIRYRDATHSDESTVFWFNLAIGIVVSAILGLSGELIARFYGISILAPLSWVMAGNVLISALGSIHRTLLTKRLEFRSQMKIGFSAAIISGMLAIWMAWVGFGVWSLAAQTVAATVVTTGLLWRVSGWRPLLKFRMESARRLFGFGGYLLGASLLDVLFNRLYTMFIGKMFGVRELGFYDRADATKQLPVNIISTILSRVALPVFSEAADEPARLKRGLQLCVRALMLVNLPMMLGMAALAKPLTLVILGEKWLPSVPILQVLCLAGIFWPLHVINLNVLLAQGHSLLFFRLELVKKTVGILLLLIGAKFGVMGIAWSTVIFGLFAFAVNAHYSKAFLNYGTRSQVRDFLPSASIAACMAVAVSFASNVLIVHPLLKVGGLTLIGMFLFLGAAFLLRLRALADVASAVRGLSDHGR